jgi:hypothetical protein
LASQSQGGEWRILALWLGLVVDGDDERRLQSIPPGKEE